MRRGDALLVITTFGVLRYTCSEDGGSRSPANPPLSLYQPAHLLTVNLFQVASAALLSAVGRMRSRVDFVATSSKRTSQCQKSSSIKTFL